MGPYPDSGSRSQRPRVLAALVLPPVGATLILLSYHHAAELAEPDQMQFALYWGGFLGGMLPLIALACKTGIDDVTRTCALAGLGLFGTVPRLLRTPFGPQGSDEFVHLRQTLETYLNGDVGHASPLLQISKEFPGLHQTVSAFARLTGLPLWHAGMSVVALAHILSVLAVYQLVRAVGASRPGAAVGAVAYTLNPSWVYFDTTVSYESLALPVLLWCLAATVTASSAPGRPDLRCIAVTLFCAAALPVIHHLTTIFGCLILAVLIIAALVHRARRSAADARGAPREHLWPLLLTASCLLMSIVYWWSEKYEWLVTYLSPALTRGWAQLSGLIDGSEQAAEQSPGKRAPFSGALIPVYEMVSGFLFPAVLLVLFSASLVILWRNRRRVVSAAWAFAVVAAAYFGSMPMVLTKGGAEGAHRSWAFSFIGIAVLCGLAWSFGPRSGEGLRWRWMAWAFDRNIRRLDRPGVRVGVVGVVLCVLLFGGAALGTNVSTRFPGPPVVGDDSRGLSREGEAVTAWIVAHSPLDTPVLADRWVSQLLGSIGRMAALKPSAPFPVWDLYMSAEPVRPDVLKQVLDAKIRYFVVDARMSTTRPRIGYWFTKDEPGVDGPHVFPQVAIDRFNCLPWLRARFGAGFLTVYQVDANVLLRTMAGSCERRTR